METDLYVDAVVEGIKEYRRQTRDRTPPDVVLTDVPSTGGYSAGARVREGTGYWVARYAARATAGALLEEAQRIGVTPEQYEALRKVAADVAYD